MPEKFLDENWMRAAALQKRGNSEHEFVVFLFLVSNNLVGTLATLSEEKAEKADRCIVSLFKVLLGTGPTIASPPPQMPTMQAVIDRLFASAIRMCDVDCLKCSFAGGLT